MKIKEFYEKVAFPLLQKTNTRNGYKNLEVALSIHKELEGSKVFGVYQKRVLTNSFVEYNGFIIDCNGLKSKDYLKAHEFFMKLYGITVIEIPKRELLKLDTNSDYSKNSSDFLAVFGVIAIIKRTVKVLLSIKATGPFLAPPPSVYKGCLN